MHWSPYPFNSENWTKIWHIWLYLESRGKESISCKNLPSIISKSEQGNVKIIFSVRTNNNKTSVFTASFPNWKWWQLLHSNSLVHETIQLLIDLCLTFISLYWKENMFPGRITSVLVTSRLNYRQQIGIFKFVCKLKFRGKGEWNAIPGFKQNRE